MGKKSVGNADQPKWGMYQLEAIQVRWKGNLDESSKILH